MPSRLYLKPYCWFQNSILFFTSEHLPNVNISLPPKASLDGGEYYITPYNREIYALTALRKGKYSLGAAKFHIEGNPLSYFSPMIKESLKKTVEVLDLPSPKPVNCFQKKKSKKKVGKRPHVSSTSSESRGGRESFGIK
jgi:hypothetical protein